MQPASTADATLQSDTAGGSRPLRGWQRRALVKYLTGQARDFLAWQPNGIWNPHHPEKFGRLRLVADTEPRRTAGLTSEVRVYKGTPSLFINGKLTSQTLAAPYQTGPNDYNDFLKAGIRIYDIYFRFNWDGPEQYDFSRLDARLDAYLKINPQALFIGRVLLTPGEWFAQQYPGEITRRDDGTPAGMFGSGTHPSFSSSHYRELSHKAMIALVNHLEEKYGDNIAGYQAGNGFGAVPLELADFEAFQRLHQVCLSPCEWDLIELIDDLFVATRNQPPAAGDPPPNGGKEP